MKGKVLKNQSVKVSETKSSVSKNLRELSVQYEKDQGVLTKLYLDVFQANPSGQKVLADLAMRFYDRLGIEAGEQQHLALVRSGERNVLLYILQRCANAQE